MIVTSSRDAIARPVGDAARRRERMIQCLNWQKCLNNQGQHATTRHYFSACRNRVYRPFHRPWQVAWPADEQTIGACGEINSHRVLRQAAFPQPAPGHKMGRGPSRCTAPHQDGQEPCANGPLPARRTMDGKFFHAGWQWLWPWPGWLDRFRPPVGARTGMEDYVSIDPGLSTTAEPGADKSPARRQKAWF